MSDCNVTKRPNLDLYLLEITSLKINHIKDNYNDLIKEKIYKVECT